MSTKTLVWICVTIGSLVGGYIPTLFGQSIFSLSSFIWSGIGSIVGIWVGIKIGSQLDL